jgi:metallo-beta-lactamase class B
MFDTPWDTTQTQPLIDSITLRHSKKVVLCLATHFHDDRTAGLEYMNKMGIKTFSSKATFDLCALNNEKQAAFCFLNDTTFAFGNHFFETYYPGEGHSKDNIVVWCRDAKILYGGCLVKSCESSGLGNVADANLSEWAKSIQNVIIRYPNPKYSIPGHFGWHTGNELTHTLNLLKHK